MCKPLYVFVFLTQMCSSYATMATNLIAEDLILNPEIAGLYAHYDLDFQALGKVMDQDVHAFNKSKLTPGDYIRALLPHDQITQANLSVADIKNAFFVQEVEGIDLIKTQRPKLEMSFNTLVTHTTRTPIEAAETKLNVAQIFSRVWWMITLEENFFEKESKMNALSLVMCDNAGGCYQGYAGRIAHLYIIWARKAVFNL